jgi:hypothetical protein
VRRKFPRTRITFGNRVVLDNLLEIASNLEATPNAPIPDTTQPGSGITPRDPQRAARVAPPPSAPEPRDYHAALKGVLRPRRSG